MKIELPSPRKPAPITPKQGSLYHEMGKNSPCIKVFFGHLRPNVKNKAGNQNTVPALHVAVLNFCFLSARASKMLSITFSYPISQTHSLLHFSVL